MIQMFLRRLALLTVCRNKIERLPVLRVDKNLFGLILILTKVLFDLFISFV